MSTGYTAPIEKGISFEKFVWGCARAFGVLVEMRDDPSDAPIPEKFKLSDYHSKNLAKAKEELRLLMHISDLAAAAGAELEYRKKIESEFGYRKKNASLEAKYLDMLRQVELWEPPTADHNELKRFMISQITESIEWDCSTSTKHFVEPVRLTGEQWREKEIKRLQCDIEYHTEEHRKEVERVASRNKWIQELRESLKGI